MHSVDKNFNIVEAIKYRYKGGRDVALVEDRFNRYQAALAANASSQQMNAICGEVDLITPQCTTKVGRPKDSESLACDSLCCITGKKVGNCGSDYGVELDFTKLLSVLVTVGFGTDVIGAVSVANSANCFCSDDPIDVRCGRDGAFMDIRCPDESACWRKCCRDGKTDGKCDGFLNLKCKCS